jgi:ribose transport system substrate-binding protein
MAFPSPIPRRARRSLRSTVAVPLVGLLLLVAAGCGSSGGTGGGSTSDSDVARAKAAIERARQPVRWKAPGPPVEDVGAVRGKTFYYIGNGLDLPPIQALVAGLKESTSAVGMHLQVADGRGSPAQVSQQIDRAIGLKAAVVATTSFESSQVSAAIARAKRAGVKVILGTAGDPALPSARERDLGVSAFVTFCYSCAGRQLAQAAIADSDGAANAVVFTVPESRSAVIEGEAAAREIKAHCPGCKVTIKQAPLAQWTTGLQALTTSTLNGDPAITHLLPVWDPMATYMKPAVYQRNATDSVKIVTYNGSIPQLTDLSKGDVVATDVGSPFVWVGYGMTDQAVRLLTGMPAVASEQVPNRVFDSSNVDALGLSKGLSTAGESARYGVDFAARYRELWGIS